MTYSCISSHNLVPLHSQMHNRIFIKVTAVLLLLGLTVSFVPLHQLLHNHKAQSHLLGANNKENIQNYESPCCKPIQFLKDFIFISQITYTHFVKPNTVLITFPVKKISQILFFITNKAPPVLS